MCALTQQGISLKPEKYNEFPADGVRFSKGLFLSPGWQRVDDLLLLWQPFGFGLDVTRIGTSAIFNGEASYDASWKEKSSTLIYGQRLFLKNVKYLK